MVDQESIEEWFKFFNEKGLELLRFLLKRKQRKLRKIDQTIEEIKGEFTTLTAQLNKALMKKDKEVQNRKSKKYTRDINDFRNDPVFKWQRQLGHLDPISTYFTPE